MTSDNAEALRGAAKVVSVFESKCHPKHTTHSWQFMSVVGRQSNRYQFPQVSTQSDVIIGMLDSGFWPESPSFSGDGMPPVPSQWKGVCTPGQNFTTDLCNNKVIGAKAYPIAAPAEAISAHGISLIDVDILSSRDVSGHGSQTASTAAGRIVPNISYFGIGQGDVLGGAPGSRLAVYKVCWEAVGCADADIMAAFDDAIADGVDLISLSVGDKRGDALGTHFSDGIAVGSFHAARKNILVSAAAGNSGPTPKIIANTAPWMLTVAASTTDRQLVTNVQLQDGTIIPGGWVVNPYRLAENVPIVLGCRSPSLHATSAQSIVCQNGSLDAAKVAGTIVVCRLDSNADAESEANRVNALGLILVGEPIGSRQYSVPATVLSQKSWSQLQTAGAGNPVGMILPTQTVYGNKPAPVVGAFSGKGPSVRNPNIIKPDITAPGVDILAAFSPLQVKSAETGGRSVGHNFLSGTSMATPHITGIAALIKAVHPDWSPAAIKSAIMTTAYDKDSLGNTLLRRTIPVNQLGPSQQTGSPFNFGSGHVQPGSALDPGLVYDTDPNDYIDFLCSFHPSNLLLQSFTGVLTDNCPANPVPQYNLNYPSIGVAQLNGSQTIVRTLTNVGPAGQVSYNVSMDWKDTSAVSVAVQPQVLEFQSVGQRLSYKITFQVLAPSSSARTVWGSLTWSDGVHSVRSPMVVIAVPTVV